MVVVDIPSNLNPPSEGTRLAVEPYLSSLIADFKNITNKIPYYQKKVFDNFLKGNIKKI